MVNFVNACDIIPEEFDDFFGEFLANRNFAWGTNSFSLVGVEVFTEAVQEYIAMLQEDEDEREILPLLSVFASLKSLDNRVYVNLEN